MYPPLYHVTFGHETHPVSDRPPPRRSRKPAPRQRETTAKRRGEMSEDMTSLGFPSEPTQPASA